MHLNSSASLRVHRGEQFLKYVLDPNPALKIDPSFFSWFWFSKRSYALLCETLRTPLRPQRLAWSFDPRSVRQVLVSTGYFDAESPSIRALSFVKEIFDGIYDGLTSSAFLRAHRGEQPLTWVRIVFSAVFYLTEQYPECEN